MTSATFGYCQQKKKYNQKHDSLSMSHNDRIPYKPCSFHAPYQCSMCYSSSQHAPWPYSDPYMLPFCKHKHIPCPALSYFYLSLKICHSSNVSSAIQLCYSSLCISQRRRTVHKYMLVFFRSGVKRLVSICLKTDCCFFRGLSQWEGAALLLCCQHHSEDVTGCSCKCF